MEDNASLLDQFRTTHFFTRTSQDNLDKFYEALHLTPQHSADHIQNKKLDISLDYAGHWRFKFSTSSTDSLLQVKKKK